MESRAVDQAHDSLGAAIAVARRLAGPAGEALATAPRAAFVDAMGSAVVLPAAVALMGGVLVARFMPAAHLTGPLVPPESSVSGLPPFAGGPQASN